VRFWALSLERTEAMLGRASFWLNDDRPADLDEVFWVGAGTRDTGFSLTRLTFQVTHATDADTNAERNFIIAELKQRGAVGEINVYQPRQRLPATRVNHYITDGEVAAASLSSSAPSRPAAG
jgi:hypothetical protein